jgi:transcriptional regulator with PAS, ATPase and Fis domain
MRSLCVILLIVAHAMKYVSADSSPDETALVAATPIEQSFQPEPEIEIMEEKPEQPKALPAPKKRTAPSDNLERVREYMAEHEGASVRQVAKDLGMGISTANKWMRQLAPK